MLPALKCRAICQIADLTSLRDPEIKCVGGMSVQFILQYEIEPIWCVRNKPETHINFVLSHTRETLTRRNADNAEEHQGGAATILLCSP